MRTKVLLCAAALAASLASSMAQNVYSLNVVGYVNVTVVGGQNALLTNPLKNGNNTMNEVLPATGLPDCVIGIWNQAGQKFNEIQSLDIGAGLQWLNPDTGDPLGTTLLAQGQGFLFKNPGSTLTLTFVGEVKQGDVTLQVPGGNGCYGTTTPQDLELVPANGFPMVENNYIHTYDPVNVKYIDFICLDTGDGAGLTWRNPDTGAPVTVKPAVAQGYFIDNVSGVPQNWVRTFTVQ